MSSASASRSFQSLEIVVRAGSLAIRHGGFLALARAVFTARALSPRDIAPQRVLLTSRTVWARRTDCAYNTRPDHSRLTAPYVAASPRLQSLSSRSPDSLSTIPPGPKSRDAHRLRALSRQQHRAVHRRAGGGRATAGRPHRGHGAGPGAGAGAAVLSGEGRELLQLPDWETLPYDNFSPHQDIVSERLRTLHRLPRQAAACCYCPCRRSCSACRRGTTSRPTACSSATGQSLDVAALRDALTRAAIAASTRSTSTASSRCAARSWTSFPWAAAAPAHRPAGRRDRHAAQLRPGDAAHHREARRPSSCCRRGSFPWKKAASGASSSAGTRASMSITTSARPFHGAQRRPRAGRRGVLPAAVLRRAANCYSTTCPKDAALITVGDHYGAASASGTRRAPLRGLRRRPPASAAEPRELFTPVEELYQAPEGAMRCWSCASPGGAGARELRVQPPPQLARRSFSESGLKARLRSLLEATGARCCCAPKPPDAGKSSSNPWTSRRHWSQLGGLHFQRRRASPCRGAYRPRAQPRARRPMLVTEAQLFGERVAQRRRRRHRTRSIRRQSSAI
jgi:transcription-repair coupling factor (superfamily II helicase)